MTINVWSKVAIAVQSALATAITSTSVTKANPGVVTYTGTDPSNGDYILATSVLGMTQINNRVFRVANVNAGSNTLELEGENTTSYDTFTSGNFQVITFGTSIDSMTDINVSGGDAASIDVTTIHDDVNQEVVGNFSPITITGSLLWDPSDTGQLALKSASDSKAQRSFKFTFANGGIWLFYGYVGYLLAPTGAAQEAVKSPITIKTNGRLTAYAS